MKGPKDEWKLSNWEGSKFANNLIRQNLTECD